MKINNDKVIDITSFPDFLCPVCKSADFESIMRLKHIPPFLVGNARPLLQPYNLTRCKACSHVFTDEEINNFKPQIDE